MSTHRETDDRLRRRLNADQAGRERMCLAVLSLDGRYSNLQPRRPEGGPDGGKDLEGLLDGRHVVLGAVGFLNSVSDGPQEHRQIKKKFREDLQRALNDRPSLEAFVFMTNVDLAPSEVTELKTIGEELGLRHVDIY